MAIPQTPLDAKLTEVLRPYLDFPCCGGKLYLGSMFYLDFGQTFLSVTRGGARIAIGEMTFSVRDVAWKLFSNGDLVTDSVSVCGEKFEGVVARLMETCIQKLSAADTLKILRVEFEHGWHLDVDMTNTQASDNDVLEFALPDGRLIAINNRGRLLLDAGYDDERARHWANSRRRH